MDDRNIPIPESEIWRLIRQYEEIVLAYRERIAEQPTGSFTHYCLNKEKEIIEAVITDLYEVLN